MELKQIFLAQLEREAASTRKTLERVPEGRNDWKPHEKSMTLGYLSGLLASMPGWAEFMIQRDELDLSQSSAEPFKTKVSLSLVRPLSEQQTSTSSGLGVS